MNEEYPQLDRRPPGAPRDSLVERLDPALGEASSGIGVLLSELVRRTLRGGVAKIEEEMEDFVQEKLTAAVDDRMPQFQETAAQTAQAKAREVARQEVEAVERQARESDQRLAQEIAQTERRAEEKARALAQSALEELKQKSKATYVQVRESLDALTTRAAELDARLTHEQQARETALAQMRQALETALKQQLGELRQETLQFRARQEQLETRLAELERPRGLRALWAKLFRRKTAPPAVSDAG